MTNKRMSRVDAEIQKSLAEIISKFDDVNITGTLVYAARDKIACHAINNEFTHVLWFDSDMVFHQDTMLKMLFEYYTRDPDQLPADFQSIRMEESVERAYNASVLLALNIETVDSMIYILEDPERFGATYPILCHTDGALPEEGSDAPMYYLWKDCPVLAGLELGTFQLPGIYGTIEGDCQTAMSGLAVARRGLWDDEPGEEINGAIRLWEKLTEGAAK